MKASKSITIFAISALLIQSLGSRLHAQSYVIIEKDRYFGQTSPNATVAGPVLPFEFRANSPVAMSFTPPGGASTTVPASTGGDPGFTFNRTYATQAAMDAAFPNGNYTYSVSGFANFTLGLAGDIYPVAPAVTNGSWNSSGQLVIDPTQSATLNVNTFTGYGSTGALSHEQIGIRSFGSGPVDLSLENITPTNPSAFTSYTIPAGSLSAGNAYQGSIHYDAVAAASTTTVSGSTSATSYGSATFFTILTSGTITNAPTITRQPTNQQAQAGSTATFNVEANGGGGGVVWYKNGLQINPNSGSGSNNLTLTNVQSSDAGNYFALVIGNNGTGYVQSATVTLTIGSSTASAPQFTTQPSSQTVASGSTTVLNAKASGSPSPNYHWYFNGNVLSDGGPISGSTTSSLVISGTTSASSGSYYCIASNASGSVQSTTATLSLTSSTNTGRLINVSCRALVGTGGNILIAGIVVGGTGTSGSVPVLIRGTGPALAAFGVSGSLPDPQLQLYSGSSVLGTNNGWGGSSAITNAGTAVGAFGLTNSSSHDSALLNSLAAGPYTAQIAGQSGDTGVALAEVYDATPAGSHTPASPRLINISTRVQVGTGSNILIVGFVIGGSTSETLLIRASGPALAAFGVTGTLPDPQLQLYSGSALLGTSNGWFGNLAITNAAASVGAFAWGNPASLDSAILVTLPPGAYTAQVSGTSGDTGVALIEVYEVP